MITTALQVVRLSQLLVDFLVTELLSETAVPKLADGI